VPRYQTQLTVPPATAQADAVTEKVEVDERYVDRIIRFTPPGSAYTVKAVVQAGEAQLTPVAGSDPTVLPSDTTPEPVQAFLPGSPSTVRVRAWAPASTNEHTITVSVDMLDRRPPIDRLTDALTGRLGRVSPASVSPQDLTLESDD
jgi:hypothetical protein